MYIKCLGTRGSITRAWSHEDFSERLLSLIAAAEENGIENLGDFRDYCLNPSKLMPLTYGGHTACTQVGHADALACIDMGTGLQRYGADLASNAPKEHHIFMTHMHWDHIIGLPFFKPIYTSGQKVKIHHVHKNAPKFIKILFNGVNFPLKWDAVADQIEFCQLKLYRPVQVGEMEFTPFALDHPGGSFGYRVDAGGKSLAIAVDGEFQRHSPDELGADLKFYQDLDLILFDAQYEKEELAKRYDWGHSSPDKGVDLALREGIKHLLLTHHDPEADQEKLEQMFKKASDYMKSQLPKYPKKWQDHQNTPVVSMAYDGLVVNLEES